VAFTKQRSTQFSTYEMKHLRRFYRLYKVLDLCAIGSSNAYTSRAAHLRSRWSHMLQHILRGTQRFLGYRACQDSANW